MVNNLRLIILLYGEKLLHVVPKRFLVLKRVQATRTSLRLLFNLISVYKKKKAYCKKTR